jgi:predicted DCC family thiol-disulfide oxidoreductase YuxK
LLLYQPQKNEKTKKRNAVTTTGYCVSQFQVPYHRRMDAIAISQGLFPISMTVNNDQAGIFRFAPLQSALAQTCIQEMKIPNSIVLLEKGQIYTESTAVLHICKHVQGFWKVAYLFLLLPQWVRDPIYRWVAKNRSRWFGKKESCTIPAAEEVRSRFLGDKEVGEFLRKFAKEWSDPGG